MLEQIIKEFAFEFFALLGAGLAVLAVELIRQRIGVEKMKQADIALNAKQELAMLAVKFVEQAYKDLHGQDKYGKAAEWLADRAKEYGLRITPDEVKGLIEGALRTFKDAFGEEWAEAIRK